MSIRTSSLTSPAIELPPPFRLVTLREVGDAFAHAVANAAEEGAGTLVYVGRFDLAEFAVVLEPEEPLRIARRTIYAGMSALADAMPDRLAAVCRELTKRFEEVRRGTLAELAGDLREPPRGEVTLVVGGSLGAGGPADEGEGLRAVGDLVAAGVPRRTAADVVSRLTGVPRNVLYRGSL